MKAKKYPKADLEKKRGLFLQVGIIVALGMTWASFEWRTYDANSFDLGPLMVDDMEEEIVPITERKVKPPPPPPPIVKLIIVEDKEEIKKELEVKNMEIDESSKIEIPDEPEDLPDDITYVRVQNMPQFGNGDADILNYLAKNIRYPREAIELGISGIVYLKFVVDKKGNVADVQVLRGIGGGCDEEAVRKVQAMPKWKPGQQMGKPVNVYFNLPVHFNLQ